MQPRQHVAFELRLQQPLGRDVQQLELAALEPREAPRRSARSSDELMNVASMPLSCSSRTWSCISAISGEITMQTPGLQQRRQLEAQRLAAAGRHDREHVAAAQDVAHDLLLPGAKGIEAEALLELGGERERRSSGEAYLHGLPIPRCRRRIAH